MAPIGSYLVTTFHAKKREKKHNIYCRKKNTLIGLRGSLLMKRKVIV